MNAPTLEPAANECEEVRSYPGTDAKVGQLIRLADEYLKAAHALLPHFSPRDTISSAPMRLCAIHSIELYLNAFLQFQDMTSVEIRGLQHNLAERTAKAMESGLCLKTKTAAHLRWLSDHREYLLVRYGPERLNKLSEPNRIFATLKEVSQKVSRGIYDQPYEQSDPRFKQWW